MEYSQGSQRSVSLCFLFCIDAFHYILLGHKLHEGRNYGFPVDVFSVLIIGTKCFLSDWINCRRVSKARIHGCTSDDT